MKVKRITTLLITLILASCTNVSSTTNSPFEGGAKEVYIQPGTLRALGPIKDTFRKNGWNVNEFDEQSRYLIHLNTKKIQLLCLNENSELEVELLFLDQKSKSTIFSITAKTCDSYTNLTKELDRLVKQLE